MNGGKVIGVRWGLAYLWAGVLGEPLVRGCGFGCSLVRPGKARELERRLRGRFWRPVLGGRGIRLDRGVLLDGADKISLGDRVTLYQGCQVVAGTNGDVRIGSGSHVGRMTLLSAHYGIRIGERTAVSGGVMLYTTTNTPDGGNRRGQIRIGNDVLIGANAVLLPGVSIGNGATVGAGAVVTRDVADGAVVTGMPARPLGSRRSSPAS